jgi:hypothetical protein
MGFKKWLAAFDQIPTTCRNSRLKRCQLIDKAKALTMREGRKYLLQRRFLLHDNPHSMPSALRSAADAKRPPNKHRFQGANIFILNKWHTLFTKPNRKASKRNRRSRTRGSETPAVSLLFQKAELAATVTDSPEQVQ